ncbi:MAG TPA: universal stress protein [Anaerolineae bacterium]|nr:universal stress protein [Anaerolineae bacterium]
MFERLLVPVDGSQHAKKALKVAADVAQCHSSSVCLVHVVRDLSLPKEILDMISSGEITASRMQILQDSATIILDQAQRELDAAGITEVRRECLLGDPATSIVEYAEEHEVDLIVLGRRGLDPRGAMLGSVARKLVNMTTLPCLVIG